MEVLAVRHFWCCKSKHSLTFPLQRADKLEDQRQESSTWRIWLAFERIIKPRCSPFRKYRKYGKVPHRSVHCGTLLQRLDDTLFFFPLRILNFCDHKTRDYYLLQVLLYQQNQFSKLSFPFKTHHEVSFPLVASQTVSKTALTSPTWRHSFVLPTQHHR
jgi:hypothetical protein